jgi:hypothetical protein
MDQSRFAFIFFGGLILICLLLFIFSRFRGNQSIKQGWGAVIGIGAYPPEVDPTYYPPEWNWQFQDKPNMTLGDATSLVTKWNNFVNTVSPSVSGMVYNLFSDLQTPQSIANYGITERMVYVLTRISSLLDDPSQYKTAGDAERAFSPIAINVADLESDIKPQSGLYRDWERLDWAVDVL